MADYVELKKQNSEINYYDKKTIYDMYQFAKRQNKRYFFYFILLSFFSPYLAVFMFFYAMTKLYSEFLKEFFLNRKRFLKYYSLFQLQIKKKVVSIIGYRIEDDEVDEHLAIIKRGDNAELAQKQKTRTQKEWQHTHVGLDKGVLTTHVALIGKTGAGKTEGVRSLLNDCLKNGFGAIFSDGKSDAKMHSEFMQQAKRLGRETSAFTLNFLKSSDMAESNTFNILSLMHPVKIVEFLGSLIDTGGGGNDKYFFNRGKAMLFPIISALVIRDKVKEEGVDFEKIASYTNIENTLMLWLTFYNMSRDVNDLIKSKTKLKKKLDAISPKDKPEFEYIEKLIDYLVDNPTKKGEVESALGVEFPLLKEIYNNTFISLQEYFSQVWNQYAPLMGSLIKTAYIVGKKKGLVYFDPNFDKVCSQKAHVDVYRIIKNAIIDKKDKDEDGNEIKNGLARLIDEYDLVEHLEQSDVNNLKACFAQPQGGGGNIENPPPNAVQQHSYAQQQWTILFNTFIAYKHIFGQSKSEIDPRKLLMDNKFLYILLPALELSKDQVQILGKIIIMTIKEIGSIALGGRTISVHKTLLNISKDKITPKPLCIAVLDEYGAYPIPELDTLVAQLRSINISMILGIQDMASLKANGDDITSQERALANLTKIILKAEDKTTNEWLTSMLGKKKVRTTDRVIDGYGNLAEKNSTTVQEVDVIDPSRLMDLNSGFGVIIGGSDNDKIVYVQTFFRGGDAQTVEIKRYKNIVF